MKRRLQKLSSGGTTNGFHDKGKNKKRSRPSSPQSLAPKHAGQRGKKQKAQKRSKRKKKKSQESDSDARAKVRKKRGKLTLQER